MIPAPKPDDEQSRLAELYELRMLDSTREEMFERVVRVAQQLTGQRSAAISLIDAERQWFKAIVGLDARETPRDVAFCAHSIHHPSMNVIDTHSDPRFFDNPLVTGAPYIRSYFARTIRGPAGHALGTLCVFDPEPKLLEDHQLIGLADLARLTEELVKLRADWKKLDEGARIVAPETSKP